MKRLQKPQIKFENGPINKICGACLLVDDLAHTGISKASGGIEKAFGVSKKTLAYGTVASTTVLTCAAMSSKPEYALPFAVVSSVTYLFFSNLMKRAMDIKMSGCALVESWESHALKAIRLPLLLYSAYKLSHIGSRTETLQGIYMIGVSISAYLATSGNGMIGKAKDWLADFIAKIGQREFAEAPVRINHHSTGFL